jgi:hypothetical protein
MKNHINLDADADHIIILKRYLLRQSLYLLSPLIFFCSVGWLNYGAYVFTVDHFLTYKSVIVNRYVGLAAGIFGICWFIYDLVLSLWYKAEVLSFKGKYLILNGRKNIKISDLADDPLELVEDGKIIKVLIIKILLKTGRALEIRTIFTNYTDDTLKIISDQIKLRRS